MTSSHFFNKKNQHSRVGDHGQHNAAVFITPVPNSYTIQTVSFLQDLPTESYGKPEIYIRLSHSQINSNQSQPLIIHALFNSPVSSVFVPSFAASSTPTSSRNLAMKSSPCQENPNTITPRVLPAAGTPTHAKKVLFTTATRPGLHLQMHLSSAPAAS